MAEGYDNHVMTIVKIVRKSYGNVTVTANNYVELPQITIPDGYTIVNAVMSDVQFSTCPRCNICVYNSKATLFADNGSVFQLLRMDYICVLTSFLEIQTA